MAFKLEISSALIISSCVAYTFFNVLFLVAERWWAFAMLAGALAYIPFLYADYKEQRKSSAAWLTVHMVCTLVQLGWTIFFLIEIFVNNSQIVQNWLHMYLKNSTNARDVARYASIAMAVDGFITFTIMALCGIVVLDRLRTNDDESDASSLSSRNQTLAVSFQNDIDNFPSIDAIPRLRTTSDGNIHGVRTGGGANTAWAGHNPGSYTRSLGHF